MSFREPWVCKGMRYPVRKCGECEYKPEHADDCYSIRGWQFVTNENIPDDHEMPCDCEASEASHSALPNRG